MKAAHLSVALVVAIGVALGACSSAPPKSDTVTAVKQEAAEAAVSGEQYYQQGRYDLALQFFVQALDDNASVDNVEGVIRSRISIGQVYLATDRIDAALTMITRAREQARARSASLFVDSSVALGELYLRKDDPKKALETFQEALDAPGARLTVEQTGVLYHDIGAAWKAAGDPAKALDWLSRSLQSNLLHKLFLEAAADYYMIASVHSKQGRFPDAIHNAELALATDKQIENSPEIAKDLYALGLIASKQEDANASYDYFQRAYGVYTTLGEKTGMRKCLTELIPMAESLGKQAEAQGYQQALDRTGSP
ncbi:MAG: tetratricopeptide repeat protein [Spirochaetia bacterium]|jgi:tetratricopeptide (TPR) repeat protein